MGSARSDRWGVPLQTGNPDGVAHFDDAVEDLVALKGDPLASVELAIAVDPGLVLAQILRAYLHLYATSARFDENRSFESPSGERPMSDVRDTIVSLVPA
jgi:hypothetical protein